MLLIYPEVFFTVGAKLCCTWANLFLILYLQFNVHQNFSMDRSAQKFQPFENLVVFMIRAGEVSRPTFLGFDLAINISSLFSVSNHWSLGIGNWSRNLFDN